MTALMYPSSGKCCSTCGSRAFYIQWYDSINESGLVSYCNAFDSGNAGWIWNETNGRVANSIFLNYWYSRTALKNSKALAEELNLDPYEVVYMGVEGGQWQFGTDIETRYNAVDENGKPYTSFAIWGSDWYHEQFHKPNGRYQVGYQWEAEERERMYYTSATENAGEYSTGTVRRDDISYDSTINFQGFSKYVVEKSVINGTAFASDFNNGHGMQYFVNGQVSRDMEWTNLNLQDILPTWQWWVTSTDDNRLELDWDYGSKFYRYDSNGETYAFPYTQIGAYNGGSSRWCCTATCWVARR
ncbi:MAG: endo-beta-N-acetylglucosaminidase [Oscillospiraceae bacterium]